jgi:hypothetical protein
VLDKAEPGRYLIGPDQPAWIRARGGPVFDMWTELGLDVTVALSKAVTIPLLARVFMSVTAAPDVVAALRQWRANPTVLAVVDVCFPLMRPDAMQGVSVATSQAAMAYWTQRENQQAALAAVRAADAVTVPWAEWDGYPGWIDDLAEHNPNVHVLPDLTGDPADVGRFARELLQIWDSTRLLKDARLAAALTDPFLAHPDVADSS